MQEERHLARGIIMNRSSRSTIQTFAAAMAVILLCSALLVSMVPTPAGGEIQDEFSNGKETKTIYAERSGTMRQAANITLPYDANVDDAVMTVSTVYNNGSYLDEPALKIKPKSSDIIIWEFDGQGYGEFGRQTEFRDEKISKSLDFPDDGDEFTVRLRMPKNATISNAVMEVEGEAIGYGDVARPENVTGGTHYPHSTVNTPDIVREGGYTYAAWVDYGDLDYANTDADVFFKYSEDDGASWSETRLLSNVSTDSCYHPEIAAYGEHVYVIWQSSTSYRINFRISQDNGRTWGGSYYFTDPYLRTYSSDTSSIAAASDGWVYITWEESTGIYKMVSSNYGESWSGLEKISYDVSGMSYSEPTIADDGDHVYIGYIGYYRENITQEYTLFCNYSSNNGADWGGSEVTSAVNETIAMPQIAAYHGNHVYFVVATDQEYDSGNISFIRSDDNGQSWNDPVMISADPLQAAEDPDISVFTGMGTQDLYVCWEHAPVSGNIQGNISFSKSVNNGDSWQAIPTPITTSDDNTDPALTSDQFSRVYVVWNKMFRSQLEGYEDIYIRTSGQDGGNSWNEEELFTTETFDGESTYPDYYLMGDDHYFVWQERGNHTGNGNDYDVFFRYKDGENDIWHEQMVVSDDDEDGDRVGYPSVAADSDDTVYVVWTDNGDFDGDGTSDTDVLFRTASNHGDGAWTSTELISQQTGTNFSYYPALAVHEQGASTYVGVCWSETDGYGGSGTDRDIFFRMSDDGGASWDAIEVASVGSTNTSDYPDIAMDGSFVYIIWQEYNSTEIEYNIFVGKRPLAGGAWDVQEIASSSDALRYANIAVSGDGYVYASWMEYPPLLNYYLHFRNSADRGESWSDDIETDMTSAGYRYHQLNAYEDFVALIYIYSSNAYVNASMDRGNEGSWLGSVEVSIDGNSSSAQYPLCRPSPDKDGIYCAWMDRGNISGTSYDPDVLFTDLSLSEHYPTDPAIDVGADGDDEWSYNGDFKEKEQFDFKSELQRLLNDADITGTDLYFNDYVDLNITISSEDKGRLILRNMTIEYNVSVEVTNFDGDLERYLSNHEDEKDGEGNIRVPIDFYTRSKGALHLSELEVTYSFEPHLDLDPVPYEVTGELEITWSAEHFGGEDLALYYYNFSEDSPDWMEITTIDPDAGSYLWDVSEHNGEFKLKAEREDSKDPSRETLKFKIDNLAPKSTESISPSTHVNGWRTSADVYITSNDFDGSGGTGTDIDEVYYTLDGTEPDNTSLVYEEGSYIYFTTSGNHTLKYYAVDMVGLREPTRTVELKIDAVDPVVNPPMAEPSVYSEGPIPVEVLVEDELSGFDFSAPEDEPFLEYAVGTESEKGDWKALTLDYSSTTGTSVLITGTTGDEDWQSLIGNYLFVRATVNDSVGNKVNRQEFEGILIEDDTEDPNILETYVNGSQPEMTPGTIVTITVVSDELGLSGNATIESDIYTHTCILEPGTKPGEYVCEWDTTGLEPYIYDLTISLWDGVGNTETVTKFVTVREEARPDVQATFILVNNEEDLKEVGIGAMVYVNVTLHNYGDLEGTNVVVIFKDNGVEFDRVVVDSIEPNKNKEVTGEWEVSGTAGEKHTITVLVGEEGTPQPYREDIELARYPDLTVNSVAVYENGKQTTTLTKGKEYTIKAEVENVGDDDVSGTTLEFEYRTGTSQVGIIDSKILSLNAGKTKELQITWKPSIQGTVTITAVADPDETVSEIHEDNNEKSTEVTIEGDGGSTTTPTEDDGDANILLPILIVVVLGVAGIGVLIIMKQKKEEEPGDGQADRMYRLHEETETPEPPAAEELVAERKVAPPPPPAKTKLKCPSCKTVLSVATPKRPVRITCPTCTTSILLKEEGEAVADKKEEAKESEEKKEEKAPVKLKCSGCDAVMVIKQTQRPIVVKCPQCQTKTTLDK